MDSIYFFEIERITEDNQKIILDEFQSRNISFTYFQVEKKYYLFFYDKNPIKIDFLSKHISLLQELNSKERRIRSLRGFFI